MPTPPIVLILCTGNSCRSLEVTCKLAHTAPWYGASLLLAHGICNCSVIVLAATSTEVVQKFINWSENSKAITRIKGAFGALVVLSVIWMIYTAP